MPKYLAYYATEEKKYKNIKQLKVTEDDIARVCPGIFAHFNTPNVQVRVSNAKRWSWYRPGGGLISPRREVSWRPAPEIVVARSMMNWLIVAHETAHALHCWDYNCRSRYSAVPIPEERWHGVQHKEWMEKVINYLKGIGIVPETNKPTSCANQDEVKKWNELKRQECMSALPAVLVCPRCTHSRSKEDFGVRVMRKSKQGRAIKVARQSYCRQCR